MRKLYLGSGLYIIDHADAGRLELFRENTDACHNVILDDEILKTVVAFVELSRNVKIEITRKPKFSHGVTDPEARVSGAM